MDSIYYFIMVPMVYLAVAWAAVGIVARVISIGRKPKHPHTLKIFPSVKAPAAVAAREAFAMPTIRRYQPVLWVFLVLFHLALVLLLLAHIDLIDGVNIMPADNPHMIGHGGVGLVLTVSILYLLFRRFRTPVREITVPADYLLLFLLFLIFLSGDIISWGNSWNEDGFVITKQDFGLYLRGLVNFTFENPRELLYGSHYIVVVVHVLLANLFLLILPFSKIMHTFFAVPLSKLRRM